MDRLIIWVSYYVIIKNYDTTWAEKVMPEYACKNTIILDGVQIPK